MITKDLPSKLTFLCLILSIFTFSCSKKPSESQPEPDPFAESKALFTQNCSSCHGAKMEMFVDRKWKNGNTVDSIARSVTNGYADLGMPAFDTVFTEAQIKELALYIRDGIDRTEEFTFDNKFNPDTTFNDGGINFTLELISDKVDVPWGYAFLPDNSMLITDKDGDMFHRLTDGTLNKVSNVPAVLNKGQGGLLDIELDPDFAENKLVYISYSKFKKEGDKELATTAVVRARYESNTLRAVTEIFEAQPYLPTKHHYGGRLEFDDKGYLFISVGDRGRRDDNPQSLENHCGKIHRIHADGAIPEDNPFVNTDKAKKSIWSYGHRNPQGLIFDKSTGILWEHEHGPRGGDELNTIKKGANYGWPLASFGLNYSGTIFTNNTEIEGMENSVKYWVPSIAPCGMALVTSDQYGHWKGDILIGSLRFKYLAKTDINGSEAGKDTPLIKNIGRMRNVKLDNEGFIYVSTENPGAIYKMIPEGNASDDEKRHQTN